MGQKVRHGTIAFTLAVALAGCSADGIPFGADKSDDVTRAATTGAFADAQSDHSDAHRSEVIDALLARHSVLPEGSAYARVADATLSASARSAEAELRQARLRAKAADKNWLPTLGPQVSLYSLSSFVASIVIDQVIFDNGRRKAEREFARADVEAAAVALSQDQNDRVHTALTLYLKAEEAREAATVAAGALSRMNDMEAIMLRRVEGGISDTSELAVVRAKVAELTATRDNALRTETTARAELAAMTDKPLSAVRGVTPLSLPDEAVQPLTLHLAMTERDRAMAQAKIARAGLLPGVSASGALSTRDGATGPNLQLSSDSGFGFSTPDSLRAVKASQEAADRRVSQAEEDAARRLAALGSERSGLAARAGQSAALASQGQANANLFRRQFEAGTRTVTEVVGVIETMARLDAEAITAKYAAARVEIEIARELGLLADGSAI